MNNTKASETQQNQNSRSRLLYGIALILVLLISVIYYFAIYKQSESTQSVPLLVNPKANAVDDSAYIASGTLQQPQTTSQVQISNNTSNQPIQEQQSPAILYDVSKLNTWYPIVNQADRSLTDANQLIELTCPNQATGDYIDSISTKLSDDSTYIKEIGYTCNQGFQKKLPEVAFNMVSNKDGFREMNISQSYALHDMQVFNSQQQQTSLGTGVDYNIRQLTCPNKGKISGIHINNQPTRIQSIASIDCVFDKSQQVNDQTPEITGYTRTYTNWLGGKVKGTYPFEYGVCANQDGFISQIRTRAGNYVDGISVQCNNDAFIRSLDGGTGGVDKTSNSEQGFSKLEIFAGDWIDGIKIYDNNKNLMHSAGITSGTMSTIDCGDGLLSGIKGNRGSYLNQIQGICSTPIYKQ